MPSVFEALNAVFAGSKDILFLNDVLRQYREVRKVYWYEYDADDKAALQACATDLRPFSYGLLPACAAYWGVGKQLGRMARASLLLLRLTAATEVLRVGYRVGSYKHGMDCTQRLISLRSALGGEISAIIREREPQHPLLRFERPPPEQLEDGSRARIKNEANRLAQIAHLQQELGQAKAGEAVDRSDASADERLFRVMSHRAEALGEMQRGGGPAAAASTGELESMRPARPRTHRAEYEAAAAGVAGGAAAPSSGGEGSRMEDPLAMLLGGGGGGGWWAEDGSAQGRGQGGSAEEARERRRQERRARWWRRSAGPVVE